MNAFSSSKARDRWYELLAKAERGEEITITRRGRPIGKLVPLTTEGDREPRGNKTGRRLGENTK